MGTALISSMPMATQRKARLSTFTPLSVAMMPQVIRALANSGTRGCDFTIGGLYLWADYFHYSAAIIDETLFIQGVNEDDRSIPAFSAPVGRLPLERSIPLIRDYCQRNDLLTRFSAVPQEMLPAFEKIPGAMISELTDFADYIYDATALATLSGKKLGKKRNHVNHFMALYPGYSLRSITSADIPALLAALPSMGITKESESASYEAYTTAHILQHLHEYPFEAAMLSTPDDGIVAFTIGETCGDTLHIHIEKMNHLVEGSGETINKLFAEKMLAEHPEICYINRQDDAGDPGLRYAKESYHPSLMLKKYNVTLP